MTTCCPAALWSPDRRVPRRRWAVPRMPATGQRGAPFPGGALRAAGGRQPAQALRHLGDRPGGRARPDQRAACARLGSRSAHRSVAALVAMVPQGLVLLTSVAFAVAAVPPGTAASAGQAACRRRGPGPGRCHVLRQDRHSDQMGPIASTPCSDSATGPPAEDGDRRARRCCEPERDAGRRRAGFPPPGEWAVWLVCRSPPPANGAPPASRSAAPGSLGAPEMVLPSGRPSTTGAGGHRTRRHRRPGAGPGTAADAPDGGRVAAAGLQPPRPS